MSTVFYNLFTVTGKRDAVRAVCADARRPIAGKLSKTIGTRQIDWSFEKLFESHPALSVICGVPPSDEWHYGVSAGTVSRWGRFSRARFRLEVKNYQIHEMLRPLSKFYPALCFVNAELCLDDGTVMSAFAHRGRGTMWNLPQRRTDAQWKRAAVAHKVSDMDDAYEDDDVRDDAEFAMLLEALAHWDERVRHDLVARIHREGASRTTARRGR